MTDTGRRWWELELVVPAEHWCATVAEVGGSLLRTTRGDAAPIADALLVRDVTAQGVPALYVQARAASGGDLAEAYRALLGGLPRAFPIATDVIFDLPGPSGSTTSGAVATAATAVVRPANLVPLAGPVFGGSALPALTRAFLRQVGPVLVQLAAAGRRQRQSLVQEALSVMAAQLAAQGPSAAPGASELALNGVPLGFVSFRSHAEAFLSTCRDPAAARASMDERYRRARSLVDSTVAGVFRAADAGLLRDGPAGLWYAVARAARRDFEGAFRAGDVRVAAPADPSTHGNDLARSGFHRRAAASDTLQRYIQGDPAFLAVRLGTSLLYLGLHSAGLTMAERYLLCYLVSRGCETLSGTDALSVLESLSAPAHSTDAASTGR
ncbi:hypothetical protein [Micromonospora carbonacea]|uniref:Thiopeptide-type bacteriocin biosynthesis domain-containing protein n=1 Tax=Micromonospora carbonacea TaxID=47853 RepID=A0A7H8XU70_9ACTN|nr:hypothetical protein [Micromonospora carbonacea]MBB5830122.1 hypothetical protein [Micromonospora carbonacea]QLD27958.1 hypothetical protein HXZ27_30225 [Micromonospora carbonacea]